MRKSILPLVFLTLLAAQSPSCAGAEEKISDDEIAAFFDALSKPEEAIKLLKKQRALAETRSGLANMTPLQQMVTFDWKDDHEVLAKLLLKHGCDIDADLGDADGVTALMIAVLYRQKDNVKWLLAQGAKQRALGHPKTALKIAYERAGSYQEGLDEHQQCTKVIDMLEEAKKEQDKKEPIGAKQKKQATPRFYWLASPFALVTYVVIAVCAAYYLYGKARQGGRKGSRQPRMKRRAR